jgi:hypothetical protein
MHRKLTALALAATAALGVAALARAGEPQEKKVERRIIVHGVPGEHAAGLPDPAQIPGDHLKIEDLASYAPGESRSYTTESGAEVTITRAADGGERYTLSANGKQIEIGGTPEELALATGDGAAGKRVIIRHHDKAGDEGAQEVEIDEERTIPGPMADLLVDDDRPPPLVVEIAGEKDGKATRQVIVLKVVEKNENK